jgi:tRNA A37 N6-isopentenylltransferase MiaA
MSYLRCLVRLYPQLFVGGLMSYLRCLVRVYLQLFVGGLMSYLRCLVRLYPQLFEIRHEPSYKQLEVNTNQTP